MSSSREWSVAGSLARASEPAGSGLSVSGPPVVHLAPARRALRKAHLRLAVSVALGAVGAAAVGAGMAAACPAGSARAVSFSTAGSSSGTRSGAASVGRPATGALPKVVDCTGKAVFEPKQYVLACADYNSYFSDLHWTAWTAKRATATGTYHQNDCEPDCASGHFWTAPATLVLTTPRASTFGVIFTSARFSYTRTFVTSLPTRAIG